MGLVGVIAARTSGRVIERVGPRRIVLVGLAMFGTAAFVLPLTSLALPLAVATFAVWAFGTWFGIPGLQTIIAGLSETARGTFVAFNGSAINLGGFIGPIVTGLIIESFGFGIAGPWSALLAATAFVIALRVLPHGVPERLPGDSEVAAA